MEHRVVVGISGTEAAHPGLAWALDYASASDASVELVHVVDIAWRSMPQSVAEEALLHAEQQLREEAERVRSEHPTARVHATALVGDPDRTLAAHAAGDLLVLGNRAVRRGAMSLFANRAARIARRAAGSVVVFPDSDAAPGRGIVAGVDGTEVSASALAFAAKQADRLGEPLTAVHAWWVPELWAAEPFAWQPAADDEDEHAVLGEAVAGLRVDYPDLELTSEVAYARPADALHRASEGARMLVVGSHGYKGIEKLWLGSTSEELLLTMPCPVAVIRPTV